MTDTTHRPTAIRYGASRSHRRLRAVQGGLVLLIATTWFGAAPELLVAENGKITRNVGVLAPYDESAWITDQDIAAMIDKHFEDGNPGDGTVNSNIVIFATQCYGGNFVENFDDQGGFYYDNVTFTDTTIAAASDPERVAYYGGYHVGASAALRPGATVQQVHIAGILSKDQREAPFHGGDLSKVIGGRTSTHVLIWAADPNERDRQDITKVVNNMQGAPGLTVHVLAGDGSTAQGTSAVTGPATKTALDAALKDIGKLMDDGDDIDDEQFVMFLTDHGSRFTDLTDFKVVPPSSQPPGAVVETTVPMEVANSMLSDPNNDPQVVIVPTGTLTTNEEAMVGVDVEGGFLGTLADADQIIEVSTLLGNTNGYAYDISESTLLGVSGKVGADINLSIGITNFGTEALEIGYAGVMTGSVAKPESDSPAVECDDPGALCLQNDRFAAQVEWRAFDGSSGGADVVPFGSDDSGLFWFFSNDNWEMLIKIIDGCEINDHYWVFAAATTNVEYELTVTDTATGTTQVYSNPLGQRADAITDTSAFSTCFAEVRPTLPPANKKASSVTRQQRRPDDPSAVLAAPDSALDRIFPATTAAQSTLLFDQSDGPASTASTSQRFSAPLEAFDSQIADDFTLASGFWTLDRIGLEGVAEGPGVLDIYLYENDGGRPGQEVYRALGLQPADGLEATAIQLDLPSPPTLPGGTYWVSAQARLDDVQDQWAWRDRTLQTGAPAQFRNPDDGFGTGCTEWTARRDCTPSNTPDQIFAVYGQPAQLDACSANSSTLCLNDQRFQVQVRFADFAGQAGTAQTVPFGSNDSGLFWFFQADNWEMLVKVLDACGVNNRYWVFAAATTDVEYTLEVTDTQTGITRTYGNELGRSSPAIADTDAFATCP